MTQYPQPTPQQFLLAARQCEIQGLEQLAQTCELVGYVSRLVHALQRERGASNVFLASGGSRFSGQRTGQAQASLVQEQQLKDFFARLDLQPGQMNGHVRQFTQIAAVLQALDALPQQRQAIAAQQLTAARATEIYTQLISHLLAVVFEAADAAMDPDMTRLLVAMFNFMQGKELAGQERAWGAVGFAAGYFEAEDALRLQLLVEAQARCFEIFTDFAPADARVQWTLLLSDKAHQELLKLRQIVERAGDRQPVPSAFSEIWYEVATARIDRMKNLEDQLSESLRLRSETRIEAARQTLRDQQQLLRQLDSQQQPATAPPAFWVESQFNGMGRSLYELLQTQSQHLQRMSDELQEARQALNERKLIEKAKGLLMLHRRLTEEQAWRQLRQTAMDQNRRLVEVAERVISLVDLLQDQPPGHKS